MTKKTSGTQLLILVCLNFFTLALITNIPGALLPYWKESFNLSSTMVSFLGSAFFLAYGLTSLPLGMLIDKIGNKKTFLFGMSLVLLGSVAFGLVPKYEVGLVSLFAIGIGITALQLAGNLTVKKIDEDPSKYSRNLTTTQVFMGVGGLGGSFLIVYLIKNLGFPWQSIYFIFAALTLILILFAAATKITESNADSEQKGQVTMKEYAALLKNPLMLFYALGIFIYVGIEVGIATWIASFLVEVHNFAKSNAAMIVGLYWGFQSVGRFVGGFVLNYLETSKALIVYALGCLISLLIAATSASSTVAVVSFIAIGFFTSIMFPSIFSLAVNSFDKRQEGTVAGVLCTAIVGGAVLAPVIGFIGDKTSSLSLGLIITGTISFLYIALIGLKTLKKPAVMEEVQTKEA